jgi:hypothetical protein
MPIPALKSLHSIPWHIGRSNFESFRHKRSGELAIDMGLDFLANLKL